MDEHLDDLYQEIILAHNKRPKNEGELDPCTGKADGFNPVCGDKVTVFVNQADGKISDVKFIGDGCAISRASASIMTTLLTGMTLDAAKARAAEFYEMLTSAVAPELDFIEDGEVAALVGVRKFPARIKCATLAWHAMEDALKS
ncbi:MAG: nitrogen fixation NifU-like protein [Verrucomicrobiales bacterium]|jgi:nitrogen fixation NifU-like protein